MKAAKPSRALGISLSLNLILFAWVLWSWLAHPQRPGIPAPAAIERPTNSVPLVVKALTNGVPDHSKSAPKARFDWRQVESPDYKEYIANLRAIGCPEKTIQEIITADVNDLFSMRRAAITRTNHYEYWRPTPVTMSEEQRTQLQGLTAERSEVLKALGISSNDWSDLLHEYYRSNFESNDLQLEFLDEPKHQALKDLLYQMAQQALAAGDDHLKQSQIEEKTQIAVKALLTPEEFRDYELRTSVPAAQLREVLKEMEPSEEEFRAIFDQWNAVNSHSHGSAEYRGAQQTSEAALGALLGPERLGLYLQGVQKLNY